MKAFTRENLGWKSKNYFPESSFKGSDSRLVLAFLVDVLQGPIHLDETLQSAKAAATAMRDFLHLCFSTNRVYFQRSEAEQAVALLGTFLSSSYDAAQRCFDSNQLFFNFVPKHHYVHHIQVDLQKQLRAGASVVLNPSVFSTHMAEDHVGRSSVVSRSVHARTIPRRTAQKWLISTKRKWDQR